MKILHQLPVLAISNFERFVTIIMYGLNIAKGLIFEITKSHPFAEFNPNGSDFVKGWFFVSSVEYIPIPK